MDRTDPRERYDDLVVRRERHEVDAERFDDLRDAEVFGSGWGVAGVVLDGEARSTSGSRTQSDDGERLLAIRNEAYPTEWTLPGGAVEDGERLDDAVVREVREETGVAVEPVRPVGVDESVVVCEDGVDRRVEMAFVHFLCRATDSAVADGDLGDPDETITEAAWLESLPDDVFNPDHTDAVYERARELRGR
ncbi:NUDIX domain-containing protein [Halosimplex litoreum]|uniref:NUDIX domain-containing protein n=1 Tax=Halosimplex litoreum TaxID=1198301 RepID=A0A7T3G107_9EURY|nr:NUDIX domain-containing protein [Halosimplex litoreum]QPV64399.1 NUDIX domain-containing protein [Halosimplex litoreum]